MNKILPSFNVFKTKVHIGQYSDIITIIDKAIKQHAKVCIDTSNTVVMSLAATDTKFRQALSCFDILVPDSMPLVWYLKLLGANIKTTCYGPETTLRVWNKFSKDYKIMIIGSDEKTRSLFEKKFSKPVRWVTDKLDPDKEDNMNWLKDEILETDPDIIFLGLGCPKSYYVLEKITNHINKGAIIHIGGSFDLISGRKKVTPYFIQKMGLGWLFRLLHEPKRLYKRYLKFNTLFIILSIIYFIKDKRYANGSMETELHLKT